ncbi:MAG TPA: putative peptidoglycan glycosyltransferase FtsW [Methylomirabilota bacterium]|nr:putative peptidoglycan glycosyltransferase FtsW [Methylomirabilota bacterium]
MMTFARTDTSVLSRWWWTVDRWMLAALGILLFCGVILVLAASPAVSVRIGLDRFYLARHHLVLMPVAIAIVFGTSLLNLRTLRRVAAVGLAVSLVLTAFTLVVGSEIKGATRWIDIAGFSLQPSEFIKPTFAVVAAWMFAAQHGREPLPGNLVAIGLYGIVVTLLLLQPDLGMTVVVSALWFAEFFLAGLPIFWVGAFATVGLLGLGGAYLVFNHVRERVDNFLDPSAGDSYQVDRSLEAFMNGGLYGRGPGEGTVKMGLPDAHADFIFAVAGEEFGLLLCLFLVGLFGFIVLRGLTRLLHENNLFVLLATAGLIVTFGLQAVINMASTLHLMPTKGMTLPFISYGGSSLLALSFGMGMVLALTRRRAGLGDLP